MKNSPIAILYWIELRAILRDRRVVFFSFVLPFLLAPMLLLVSRSAKTAEKERATARVITLAVTGDRAAEARRLLVRAMQGETTVKVTILETPPSNPAEALAAGDIDAYAEMVDPDQADVKGDAEVKDDAEVKEEPRLPVLRLSYRQDRTASLAAETALRKALADDRRKRRDAALVSRGLVMAPEAGGTWLSLSKRDVATAEEVSGSRAGLYLTAMIVLLMLVGGASIASDSIAGEKERGTLETLLSAGVGRSELLASKLLLIFTATIATTAIQIVNLTVCARIGLLDEGAGPTLLAPLRAAPALALLFLPVSALIAAVLLIVFGLAKSYKEAQLYFTPLTLIGPALALAPALPGLTLRSAVAAVPLVGVSVAVKGILVGNYDWPMIAVAWLSTAGAAYLLMRAAPRVLSAERLILPSAGEDPKDGQALLGGRVLGWFAALWALYFLLSASSAGVGIKEGVLLSQALFVVVSAFLIRRYRLKPKEALSLRRVNPIVWPAVLLGAPSAAIVAQGLFRVVSRFLPLPTKALEELAGKLLAEDIPTWQIVILFALLPAICEEIAFRGVLLHGLRRRLRPISLCITVGAIFGLFHLALFRLVTTAFLGALLTGVVLLTGSILPSMLWHALNNGSALIAARFGLSLDDLPTWAYGVAILGLCVSFLLLWKGRARSPDPNEG